MQIVTDSGTDVSLVVDRLDELNIHVAPLVVTLGDNTYREGIDLGPDRFYPMLADSEEMPVTSQPAVGDLADIYRRLAATDPDILSIHMSSGLSGTYATAQSAAELVPEANITHVDTKTLSVASGWQVAAAAQAVKDGRSLAEILTLLQHISDATDSVYTLEELQYLIHGGRISHLRGLLASVLRIKPLIGVEKEGGTYVNMGRARSFSRALSGLADLIERQHEPGSTLRVQIVHGDNPEGAEALRETLDARFDCRWLSTGQLSLVLGAHTGPTMVGVAFAPEAAFSSQS